MHRMVQNATAAVSFLNALVVFVPRGRDIVGDALPLFFALMTHAIAWILVLSWTHEGQRSNGRVPDLAIMGTVVVLSGVALAVTGSAWRNHSSKYEMLDRYEQEELARASKEPTLEFKSLREAYVAHNQRLVKEIRAAVEDDARVAFTVVAPAGSGKSKLRSVLPELLGVSPPEVKLISLCTKKVAHECEDIPGLKYEPKPDLIFGEGSQAFNNLSAIVPGSLDTEVLFDASTKRLIIVDDLDEIHGDSSKELLRRIDDLLKSSKKPVVFVVFGRGEAFRHYFADTGPPKPAWNHFRLVIPGYRTKSNIKVVCSDWAQSYKEKSDEGVLASPDEAAERIIRYDRSHPWLRPTMSSSLETANVVCEAFSRVASLEPSELKRKIVGQLMFRAKQKHGRPTYDGNNTYSSLIDNAAAQYAGKDRAGLRKGYFPVDGIDDRIVAAGLNGKIVAVSPEALLFYSGLVDVDPIVRNTVGIRFHPLWLHKYFVERKFPKPWIPPLAWLWLAGLSISACGGVMLAKERSLARTGRALRPAGFAGPDDQSASGADGGRETE